MIQVGVGQDDRVNRRRIDRERVPVAQPELFQSLKQAAIHQNPASIDLQEVLGLSERQLVLL